MRSLPESNGTGPSRGDNAISELTAFQRACTHQICRSDVQHAPGIDMAKKSFSLMARISTDRPKEIRLALGELLPKGVIIPTDEGFLVKASMHGEGARELNRTLLSALRRVERKTRLRAEWKSGDTIERFFDYVPKASRKS